MGCKKPCPPRAFHRFFRWYCHPRLLDHIEGDIIEVYNERLQTHGKRNADIRFIIDVILLCRPGIIKTKSNTGHSTTMGMYKSFILNSWRQLIKNKGYSAINITGLTLGITVAIFIGLWIHDEISFDRYHTNYDRIGAVYAGEFNTRAQTIFADDDMQFPVGPTLKRDYPQLFKHVLLSSGLNKSVLTYGENKVSLPGVFIEPGILDMLTLKMLHGNHASLDNPNSVVLSQSTAKILFGNEDPIGKSMMIQSNMEAQVTGIFEDIPMNNHFAELKFVSTFSLWASVTPWVMKRENDWDNRPFKVYVELQPHVTLAEVNEAIHDVYEKNVPADYWATVKDQKRYLQVIPMSTWHLYNEFVNGQPTTGRITYVWLFGITGIFVLTLACINFVNLSTARSEKRAREVGIRKAIGSARQQLVLQFLTESLLVVVISFVAALFMLVLLQPSFNQLAGKDIRLPFDQPLFILLAIGFIILTGFVAGMYPAFFLSSFQPVKALKGALRPGRMAALPRKMLVVAQFSVSVVLAFGTVIVYQQIKFGQERPVGYSREGLIMVPTSDPNFRNRRETLRTELLATGVVTSMAMSSAPVSDIWNITAGYDWAGHGPDPNASFVNSNVSPEFGQTVGWEFVAGRDFSRDIGSDTLESIIINEAAVTYMGLQNPIGEVLRDIDQTGKLKWSRTIIGVVKNNLTGSPYEAPRPSIYYHSQNASQMVNIRIHPEVSVSDALPKIQAAISKIVPTALFEYEFVDDAYNQKFSQEVRVGKLAGVFAVLAILISCMGLFGLASFVAEQRTKEIGIRKVMGASIITLWNLLSKDFIILVAIACVVALPAGYYLMTDWLAQYQYHTEVSWWIFAATCGAAFLMTLLTVSFQSIKAALSNPIRSLRSE